MVGETSGCDRIAVYKEQAGGLKPEVTRSGPIDYARVEVFSGGEDQISRVDTLEVEPRIEPLTSDVHEMLGLDGVIEEAPVSVLLDSGSRVMAILEEVVKDVQRKASVSVQGIRHFRGN